MGCSANKMKNSHKQSSNNQNMRSSQSTKHNHEQRVENQNCESFPPQSPALSRKLKHMVSSDEVNKYLTKKSSVTLSPFGYVKNSPEQRRKLSLMNSPQ